MPNRSVIAVRHRDRVELARESSRAQEQDGYFHGDRRPVSTWSKEIFEGRRDQSPRFGDEIVESRPCLACARSQFLRRPKYLISASVQCDHSTNAACSLVLVRCGEVAAL